MKSCRLLPHEFRCDKPPQTLRVTHLRCVFLVLDWFEQKIQALHFWHFNLTPPENPKKAHKSVVNAAHEFGYELLSTLQLEARVLEVGSHLLHIGLRLRNLLRPRAMQRLLEPRLRRLELATGLPQLGAVFVIL